MRMSDSLPYYQPKDDEVDLREYVKVVLPHWRMIVGLAAVAALIALGLSFLQPSAYEARAVVAITKPQYLINFDPRMSTVADMAPPSKALITLATADDVLATLLSSASTSVPSAPRSMDELRKMLSAKASADPSMAELTVRGRDPQQAAALANAWAAVLVARASEVYGQGQNDVSYFEARLAEADAKLAKAEAALTEFQTRNESNVLRDQLSALQRDQQAYLAERETATRLVSDLESFLSQMAAYAPGAQLSRGDDLVALLMEIRTFNASMVNAGSTTYRAGDLGTGTTAGTNDSGARVTASPPLQVINAETATALQLQVGTGEPLMNKKAGEMRVFLGSLKESLVARMAAIGVHIDESTPRILSLQGQIQRLQNEADRLTMERDIVRETYETLARKTEETRIAAQSTRGQIRVASEALPPSQQAGSGRMLNIVTWGAAGLLVGFVASFVMEWWRRGERGSTEITPAATPVADPS